MTFVASAGARNVTSATLARRPVGVAVAVNGGPDNSWIGASLSRMPHARVPCAPTFPHPPYVDGLPPGPAVSVPTATGAIHPRVTVTVPLRPQILSYPPLRPVKADS